MDEESFDAWMESRRWGSFGTEDAKRVDVRLRRGKALGIELWGKTVDDLKRQLAAARPEIPSGFELTDFRELQQDTERFFLVMSRHKLMSRMIATPETIVMGDRQYTVWEARFEIVRRAIAYLEGR